mmetsp:Transcript_1600/g.2717  ORF Transcript_1600/g.2717 Transcript_1600/m.2717 type:complete len:233 (+) Transcript_1600:1059-1757(+)
MCSTALPTTGKIISPTNDLPKLNSVQKPSMELTRNSDRIVTIAVITTRPVNAQLNGINAKVSSSPSNKCTCVFNWNQSNSPYMIIRSNAANLDIVAVSSCESSSAPPKNSGSNNATPLNPNNEILATTPCAMNSCSGYFIPPHKKHIPNTSKRLEKTDPIKLACTTLKSPASKACIATTSSTAFPNVALISPPITSFVCAANSSVKTPSIDAKGTMAKKFKMKMAPSDHCAA